MKTLAFSLVLAALTLTANHLNAQDRGLFGMGPSAADYDYNYSNRDGLLNANINSNTGDGIQNDSFGAPLGSGIAILLAAGAGYAVVRRKRSRKNTMLLLACVALLGFTQCKKEEPLEPQGEQVRITLNVEDGNKTTDGSKAEVDPPHVSFKTGDQILVAYDGKYVGTITHNGTYFSGNIDATGNNTKPLYFYFLGNKDAGTLTAGTTTSCTVNISDQTGYPTLPVISFSASDQNFTGAGSYTASLHNKCSLMKFSVSTRANSPIYITGMNNQVTIDFSKAASDGDNNGFTYNKEGSGIIMLKGGRGFPVEKWAIVLPQPALTAGSLRSTYAKNGTYTTFTGQRPKIHAIEANRYYHEGDDIITMTVNTATDNIDLGDIIANKIIKNGETVIGTLAVDMQISIADGATVTLNGVNINGSGTWSTGDYAGLNCLGDATIILADGTTNIVKGFNVDYPGIHVPSGSTLTIRGTGSLNASSNGYGAGIGGGYKGYNTIDCGNIIISGGTVTATGGGYAAGIGSGGNGCSCGTITISGGTVTATGGQYAAGIGSGFNESSCGAITISGGTVEATGGNDGEYGNAGVGIGSGNESSCGDITIASTVTRVTATKGGSSATNSIGAGNNGFCGTVTIGGVVGAITASPYTYPVPVPTGAINGKFTINGSGDQVYFSQGNLQATYNGSSWSWAFATNQWNYVGNAAANTSINGNGTVSSNGTVDLFGWVGASSTWTGAAQYGISSAGWEGGYGTSTSDALKSDWGNTIGSGWRTLTKDEWYYLFNTRASGSTVNGTPNARYTQATINTDGTSVNGLILFPDNVTIAASEVTSWGTINDGSSWGTKCTSAQWAALEAKGCVFLPAAGCRYGTDVNDYYVGQYGYYWSSTAYEINANFAYNVSFYEDRVYPDPTYPNPADRRDAGQSVRLVRVVE